jgi:hypothetical protein
MQRTNNREIKRTFVPASCHSNIDSAEMSAIRWREVDLKEKLIYLTFAG